MGSHHGSTGQFFNLRDPDFGTIYFLVVIFGVLYWSLIRLFKCCGLVPWEPEDFCQPLPRKKLTKVSNEGEKNGTAGRKAYRNLESDR
jgi:hypothetical protein